MLRSPRPHHSAAAPLLALAALALSLAACDSTHGLNLAPDQPPTVTLTSGPIDTVSAPQSWLVDITWTASDPDGRVDHFEYAIDPPTLQRARMAMAETAWVQTKETHVVAHFRASHPDSLGRPGATASDFHVFVLRAVDDRGGRSAEVVRAFYAWTVAPDVRFTSPVPNPLLPARAGLPFRLAWSGHDPDGSGDGRPAAYRLRLLPYDGYNYTFLADPDSLLRLGEETDWDGWRTIAGDTTSIVLDSSELTPGTSWIAALVAVDEAGATTPYLTQDRNLLVLDVMTSPGPSVRVLVSPYGYQSPPGGIASTPPADVPAGRLTFAVEGIPTSGRGIRGLRWALDIADLGDQTPRSNEATDLAHWSQFGVSPMSVTFTLVGLGAHQFCVQAFDSFGDSSTLVVNLNAFQFTPTHDLLVVDDTRLEPDRFSAGASLPYTQPWPSAAELDTFLFARGGVPWRFARNPSGALSSPGLLAGYAFDTLGTRLGLEDPTRGVTLAQLSNYAHVLWLVDQKSALNDLTANTTVMRAMSAPLQTNVLVQYIRNGGQVWLAGGGAALASLIDYNVTSNDVNGMVFTFQDHELIPNRMMYDQAHVHSALSALLSSVEPQRSAAARGGWTGHGPDGTLSAPDYSRLPASLHFRSEATDPVPPTRLAGQASLFYRTNTANEFVSAPDTIVEDVDPSDGVRIESTLDTLYDLTSPVYTMSNAPAMLYYHGRDNPPFVFTGFDLWTWSRADCQGLVDFVLGDIWKLSKSPGSLARPAGSAPAPVVRLTRVHGTTRRAAVQMRR
jgi:hypothetical protein